MSSRAAQFIARITFGMTLPERLTAIVDGDFVLLLIGMRINRPLMVHKWLTVAIATPRMLR